VTACDTTKNKLVELKEIAIMVPDHENERGRKNCYMKQWMLLYLCGSTEPCRRTFVYVLVCAHKARLFHEALA
jgi:hypothetical protein